MDFAGPGNERECSLLGKVKEPHRLREPARDYLSTWTFLLDVVPLASPDA